MATFEELGDKHGPWSKGLTSFKIGKTGQTLKDRFDQEYAEQYKSILTVGTAPDKTTIDGFEKYMIKRFGNLPNCDNEQVGGGEMATSSQYRVYVVYNK